MCRPLSSTTASYRSRGLAGEAQLLGLDLLALDAEHPGQLAGVRGEQGGYAERAGDVGEAVGVDHDRDTVGQRVGERLLGVRASARSRSPRPARGPRRRRPPGAVARTRSAAPPT